MSREGGVYNMILVPNFLPIEIIMKLFMNPVRHNALHCPII